MGNVRFYPSMDYMLYSPNGDVGKYLSRRSKIVMMLAKGQVGVRSGALRMSIHMRHMRDPRGQYMWVGSSLNYALLHHEGTKPHVIRPTNHKMLKFQSRGKTIYAHVVRHPGTKANKYLSDNLDAVFL